MLCLCLCHAFARRMAASVSQTTGAKQQQRTPPSSTGTVGAAVTKAQQRGLSLEEGKARGLLSGVLCFVWFVTHHHPPRRGPQAAAAEEKNPRFHAPTPTTPRHNTPAQAPGHPPRRQALGVKVFYTWHRLTHSFTDSFPPPTLPTPDSSNTRRLPRARRPGGVWRLSPLDDLPRSSSTCGVAPLFPRHYTPPQPGARGRIGRWWTCVTGAANPSEGEPRSCDRPS